MKSQHKIKWDRHATSNFISDQEVLVKKTKDHVNRAQEFCDDNLVQDPSVIISCMIMTAAWVYSNMGYVLSKGIIPDILGITEYEPDPDATILPSKKYLDMSHEDLLNTVINYKMKGGSV